MSKKNSPQSNLTVALIQMNSGEHRLDNLQQLDELLESINDTPVDIVALPEMFNCRSQGKNKISGEPLLGATTHWLKQKAVRLNTHIIGGSLTENGPADKNYNTMVVIDPKGELIHSYRKIHMFDVQVGQKKISESKYYHSGFQPKLIEIKGWKFGLSICYDLRFPELYRQYFKAKVDAILIPSSFTKTTGEKHWRILCQARAIENQAYVLAPNQCGIGAGGIQTFGNSLVIDPDGQLLYQANGNNPEIKMIELKYSEIEVVRQSMPNHEHARLL